MNRTRELPTSSSLSTRRPRAQREPWLQDWPSWSPFKKLLGRMHSNDPEVVDLNEQRLQAAFNDAYTVNSIVAFLRLVTSAYLKVSRRQAHGVWCG